MDVMGIDGIDDWEQRIARQDAFWEGEIIDRPCVNLVFNKKDPASLMPKKDHASHAERWQDVEFQAERVLAAVGNRTYMGDALPHCWPDLGPDFFPALYGGEIVFEQGTSYIQPFLEEWPTDMSELKISLEHPYWKKMEQLFDAFLEVGRNKFYIGWPDLHPGADCLVGLRGPQNMALDLFDEPEAVVAALDVVTTDFFNVFDYYHNKLRSLGQPGTGWAGVVSTKKWHVTSNDFSYMIGPDQFDEFFLEGLREECAFFEASLHHLDGPGCLNHLDSLLSIRELNAIQWVWGAGNGVVIDWLDVFKKIQAAGKGIQLHSVRPEYLDVIMENLHPEGVWLNLIGVSSEEEGNALIEKVETWR